MLSLYQHRKSISNSNLSASYSTKHASLPLFNLDTGVHCLHIFVMTQGMHSQLGALMLWRPTPSVFCKVSCEHSSLSADSLLSSIVRFGTEYIS